jgi:23S rRNA pseudouridine1911/1915/1917 synthase
MEEKEFTFVVKEPSEVNLRIDKFIAAKLSQYSRSYFQHLIDSGNVLVNSNKVKRSYKLKINDVVRVILIEEKSIIEPTYIPLKIIYEDEQIIVVDKPANLITHPAGKNKTYTLLNGIAYHLREHNFDSEPRLVHRLDKDTTGVLVVAKTEEAKNFLSRQFQKRNVKKKYLAIVYGKFTEKFGKINAFIGKLPKSRKVWHTPLGKEAITEYHVKQEFKCGDNYYSLLEISPLTGRTHQIRVHLSLIGHPVCGDTEYGYSVAVNAKNVVFPRVMLHAWRLKFLHPQKKIWMEFVAEPPDDFSSVLSLLSSYT